MKRNTKNSLLGVVVFLALVLLFVIYQEQGGLSIANEYIVLLPYLILITFGMYAVKSSRGGWAGLGSYVVVGIGFALLADELNTLDILVPDILTGGLTLPYFQALIVVFSALVGVLSS